MELGFDKWCLCLTLSVSADDSPVLLPLLLFKDILWDRIDQHQVRHLPEETERDSEKTTQRMFLELRWDPTHRSRNEQHLSSEMNGLRAAAGTIFSVLGCYRPDTAEFMGLKAAHQSRWNVKSVRWREGGGVGGVCAEKSVPSCSDGSFGHDRYKCLEEKPC